MKRRALVQAATVAMAAWPGMPRAQPRQTLKGADPGGGSDSTAALRALFDQCVPSVSTALLSAGNYRVSGALANPAFIPSGGLHIECQGDVVIEVDAAAPAFHTLLGCHTRDVNSSSIRGGRLTLKLNQRCANGIYRRHAGGDGCAVDWADVSVLNARNNAAATTAENQALLIYGRYVRVDCSRIVVDGVDRANPAAGACKGLSISEINGPVTLDTLELRRVLCTGGVGDADGLAVFGHAPGGVYGGRGGTVRMRHVVAEDCQGRSIKLQTQDVIIEDLTILRQHVTSIATADIDFQVGGGEVRRLLLIYRKSGNTSPLAPGFYPVSFQQQCTDRPNRARLSDVQLRSEVELPRLLYLSVGAAAQDGQLQVQRIELQPMGPLAGRDEGMFTRAMIELEAMQVAASAGRTNIAVAGVRGNLGGAPIVGYTGYRSAVADKLAVDVSKVQNVGATPRALASVSGATINALPQFKASDNRNVSHGLAN